MKLFLIAGEASGDLHGSLLCRELKKHQPEIELVGWGGDRMEGAGLRLLKHYRELAFMGFKEVVMNLNTIRKNFKSCKEQIAREKPDAVVLIDYPGFNLRMARHIKKAGIKVFYYISPQLWAWKENRVEKVRKYVDHMMVILPFEKEFYSKHDINVEYVGHPLIEVVDQKKYDPEFRDREKLSSKPIIAVLPGSRKQEISNILPILNEVSPYFPKYQFVIAGAPGQDQNVYEQYLKPEHKIVFDSTYDLFQQAKIGLITSGTATLEAALFNLPQVVCYKGSQLSFQIAKWLVKVNFISLVNLILQKEAVHELIQNRLKRESLRKEISDLLTEQRQSEIKSDYQRLRSLLGAGDASEKAANFIIRKLA